MKSKKEYKKPKMNVVELATDEVLSSGCKFSNGGTAPGSGISCVAQTCSAEGS